MTTGTVIKSGKEDSVATVISGCISCFSSLGPNAWHRWLEGGKRSTCSVFQQVQSILAGRQWWNWVVHVIAGLKTEAREIPELHWLSRSPFYVLSMVLTKEMTSLILRMGFPSHLMLLKYPSQIHSKVSIIHLQDILNPIKLIIKMNYQNGKYQFETNRQLCDSINYV